MMLWLAVAALAASAPQSSGPAPVVVQATATVRILSGVRLKLDSPTNTDAPRAHETVVKTDGTQQPARLIEFQ
ncbi:MAG TPA: hypothetical protein VFW35_05880 [Sphingomicrobium sp.]|nr:hypothetical protein [Sphingomicrobium sp.]